MSFNIKDYLPPNGAKRAAYAQNYQTKGQHELYRALGGNPSDHAYRVAEVQSDGLTLRVATYNMLNLCRGRTDTKPLTKPNNPILCNETPEQYKARKQAQILILVDLLAGSNPVDCLFLQEADWAWDDKDPEKNKIKNEIKKEIKDILNALGYELILTPGDRKNQQPLAMIYKKDKLRPDPAKKPESILPKQLNKNDDQARGYKIYFNATDKQGGNKEVVLINGHLEYGEDYSTSINQMMLDDENALVIMGQDANQILSTKMPYLITDKRPTVVSAAKTGDNRENTVPGPSGEKTYLTLKHEGTGNSSQDEALPDAAYDGFCVRAAKGKQASAQIVGGQYLEQKTPGQSVKFVKIEEKPAQGFTTKKRVDLAKWPGDNSPSDAWFTLGDLHGNALKLLYFMVSVGAATISEDDYKIFVKIYQMKLTDQTGKLMVSVDRAKQLMVEFDQIIGRITIVNGAKIRLIGDDLCDRGANDYYTLKLIQKFKENKNAKLEVMRSNHSIEFVERFYSKDPDKFNNKKAKRVANVRGQTASLMAMRTFVNEKIIQEKDINQIFTQDYQPSLRMLSYDQVPDSTGNYQLMIYSHAPINEIDILRAACCIEQKDRTSGMSEVIRDVLLRNNPMTNSHVIKLIEGINEVVSRKEKNEELSTLLDTGFDAGLVPDRWGRFYAGGNKSLRHLLENRVDPNLMRMGTKIQSNCNFTCVHGHLGEDQSYDQCFCLDSPVGRPGDQRGDLPYFQSQEYAPTHTASATQSTKTAATAHEVIRLLRKKLSKLLGVVDEEGPLANFAKVVNDDDKLFKAVLKADDARRAVRNNRNPVTENKYQEEMLALHKLVTAGTDFLGKTDILNTILNLIDKIPTKIENENPQISKPSPSPKATKPPSASGATLLNPASPTATTPTPSDPQRERRRQYRHNMDALLSLYDRKDQNEINHTLAQITGANIGDIIPLANDDYLIVNAEMKKSPDLKKMILDQHNAYDAIKLDKPKPSALKVGYQRMMANLDTPDYGRDFKDKMHVRAQVKKWVMTQDLPQAMKDQLTGNEHVMAVTQAPHDSFNDYSKVYDNQPTPTLNNNAHLVELLDQNPVKLTVHGSDILVKGKLYKDGSVVFVKVNEANEAVTEATPYVSAAEVSLYAREHKGMSLSAAVIEAVVKTLDPDLNFVTEQTFNAGSRPSLH